MPRNLILSGGIFHPFEETSTALAELLAPMGIESIITDQIEDGVRSLGDYDLLTVNCLRWRMVQAERHEPYREEWAMELSQTGRTAIRQHLNRGGGILGLHTASICFDTWPEWRDILGASWNWERSFHPEISDVAVKVNADGHLLVDGLDNFTVHDEVFHHLTPANDTTTLLSAELDEGPQPLLWAREVGRGRVVYDALGHSPESIRHPVHGTILKRGALWALGEADETVKAA